jgi:hypothetical protein
MSAVKTQIIARVMELLEVLKQAGTVRRVDRVSTLMNLADIVPAIQVEIGGDVVEETQDFQGYELSFPLDLKLVVNHPTDPYGACDTLAEAVQTAIEADFQLSRLANMINYAGETPFVNEQLKPLGGRVLFYDIKYRRKRGAPAENY